MSAPVAEVPGTGGSGRDLSPGIGDRLYPMRIVGTTACVAIGWLYVAAFGTPRPWYGFLLLLVAVYPHLSRYLSRQVENRRRFELATVLADAFLLGSTVYVAGFSPIPTLSLVTVTLANGMALGNFPFMALSALSALVGIALPTLFYGSNYQPRHHVLMDLTSELFLLLYFTLFAWVAYRRSVLLQGSRREIRQQKLAVEIQKKKSDSLLLAILPAPAAAEFERSGAVEARRHPEAAVLVADVHEFQRVAREAEPAVLLAELNHCFKAFDQIALRHGLEPLKTVGDAYFAVGGVVANGRSHAAAAVRAAFEMRDFLARLNESRRAAGRPCFVCGYGVHAGPVISGVVETRKFSFDIWGDAVDLAVQLERAAAPAQVAVSATVLAQVEAEVVSRPLATLRSKGGDEVAGFIVEPRGEGEA